MDSQQSHDTDEGQFFHGADYTALADTLPLVWAKKWAKIGGLNIGGLNIGGQKKAPEGQGL